MFESWQHFEKFADTVTITDHTEILEQDVTFLVTKCLEIGKQSNKEIHFGSILCNVFFSGR
jgi:hypothetical protein